MENKRINECDRRHLTAGASPGVDNPEGGHVPAGNVKGSLRSKVFPPPKGCLSNRCLLQEAQDEEIRQAVGGHVRVSRKKNNEWVQKPLSMDPAIEWKARYSSCCWNFCPRVLRFNRGSRQERSANLFLIYTSMLPSPDNPASGICPQKTTPPGAFANAVPGTLRICIGLPLILLQISSAVRVVKGRFSSERNPSNIAWLYRNPSLVAGSAWSSRCWCWNSLSVVVTMFSIAVLACDSSIGNVLTSIAWLGIRLAACFSSATAARAVMQAFKTARVSNSTAGGRWGSSLNGCLAFQREGEVCFESVFFGLGIVPAYVAACNRSMKRVALFRFL